MNPEEKSCPAKRMRLVYGAGKRYMEIQCHSALNKSGIAEVDYCLNPYVGCVHRCVYCYARFMTRFSGHSGEKWGSFVDIKVNIADVLSKQLHKMGQREFSTSLSLFEPDTDKRRSCPFVMISSVTDAYQPIERDYCLTRACLQRLVASNLIVNILTKSDLVVRDLDILRLFGSERIKVGFSITTPEDRIAKLLEPGAPPTSRRFAAIEKLSEAGIRTWVFIAPLIPGIGTREEDLEKLFAHCRESRVEQVDIDPLNFYPSAVAGLRAVFSQYLTDRYSEFKAALNYKAQFALDACSLCREVGKSYGYDV